MSPYLPNSTHTDPQFPPTRRPAAIKRIPLPPGERKDAVRALVEREVGLHRFLNQNSKRVTFLYGVHLDGNDAVFTAMERCGESLSQVRANRHARIPDYL